ncbi:OLC1v1019120C1 [Oldenlandia corymbosa var. corymbosa]|uniref:OLC1v1019120C1 n=1 Tax=Oldenlandia corymbosa var. corymbosa TaxID=529605 RepID=A0AAV1ED87_OLDCO|nr:OLC1v1019120C1 [Oldenlandia corymbosa var. corymbosa]
MGTPQDLSSGNPLVFEDGNEPKIKEEIQYADIIDDHSNRPLCLTLGFPEIFALHYPDDVLEEEDDDDGSKIVLYDSDDQWDEEYADEYGYGPKIPAGYQRIPAVPPGFENACLRHYNHDLCCYDDEYDSDCQLQKALFE